MVEVRVGAALDTLPKLVEEGAGPFDLVFIDADKPNIPEYVDWSLKLSRPGTVLVVDNVVRDGGPARRQRDPARRRRRPAPARAAGRRPSASAATTIQTVGSKGYDGFTLAVVNRAD